MILPGLSIGLLSLRASSFSTGGPPRPRRTMVPRALRGGPKGPLSAAEGPTISGPKGRGMPGLWTAYRVGPKKTLFWDHRPLRGKLYSFLASYLATSMANSNVFQINLRAQTLGC